MKQKQPQEYTPAEFDAVVALIHHDQNVRDDIEAVTGQSLRGKNPRELFDLFCALQGATQVMAVVAQHGQAKRALRRTRAELAEPEALPESTAEYVAGLQSRLDEEKARRVEAEDALKALRSRTLVAVPTADSTRKAVSA